MIQGVLPLVRYWLPAVVTLAGILVMVIGRDVVALEGGAGIVGAGLSIWLLNFLYRVGAHDDVDRDEEDAARDFYDSHGHWPDEPPPPASTPRGRRATGPLSPRPGPDRGAAGRSGPAAAAGDDGPHRTAPPPSGGRRPAPPRRRRPSD
jgi:hypothetical protein